LLKELLTKAMDEEQNEIYAALQPAYLNFLAGTVLTKEQFAEQSLSAMV
jgi:hypothetical protein